MISQKPAIIQILNFFINPNSVLGQHNLRQSDKFRLVFDSVTLGAIISLILGGLLAFISAKVGFSLEDNNRLTEVIKNSDPLFISIFVVLIGPLTEELAFRLIISPHKKNIIVGGIFLIYFLVSIFYSVVLKADDLDFASFILIFSSLAALYSLAIAFLLKENFINRYFVGNVNYLVYTFGLIFAAIHIDNYMNVGKFFWLMPLAVIPQFIIGMIISYVRLKAGFWFGYMTHSLYNFVLALPLIVMGFANKNVRDILNSDGNLMDKIKTLPQNDQSYIILTNFFILVIYTLILANFTNLVLRIIWPKIKSTIRSF